MAFPMLFFVLGGYTVTWLHGYMHPYIQCLIFVNFVSRRNNNFLTQRRFGFILFMNLLTE